MSRICFLIKILHTETRFKTDFSIEQHKTQPTLLEMFIRKFQN